MQELRRLRTLTTMHFAKYHALGNDYLVLEASDWPQPLTPGLVRALCHRHYGLGADGVLLRAVPGAGSERVRIFNADGSEAEKSGNGLRILARYLWDRNLVGSESFPVITAGGTTTCQVAAGGTSVTVDMGQVSFHSRDIPVTGPPREVLDEPLELRGHTVRIAAATLGNPHCVVLRTHPTPDETRRWGPQIEVAPAFPNRTNVQFLDVLTPTDLRIEIWERGSGYTLASGSSSCAAAAVAHRLGWCDAAVHVHMPGGTLHVELTADFRAHLSGPVNKVAEGWVAPEVCDENAAQLSV